MGLSSSSQKTRTKSTSTTTPNVPSWISGPTQGIVGQVQTLAGQPVQTTPASVLQNRAFTQAGTLGGGTNANTTAAQNTTRSLLDYTPGQVNAGQLNGMDLSGYTNPWENDVVQSVLRDGENFRAMGINQNSSNATLGGGAGAFGGARAGVSDAQTNDAALRSVLAATGQLRSAGFLNAQDRATADINRRFEGDQFNVNSGLQGAGLRLTAADQLHNQSTGADANQRANLATLAGLGDTQHALDQENNQQSAQLQWLSNLLATLQQANPGLYTGQTTNASGTSNTTSTPSLLDSIGSILQTAGSLGMKIPSDRRLKLDIERAGERAGLPWYRFRYVWDEPGVVREGVMADEVPAHAVHVHESGFKLVDYAALGLA